MSRFREEAQDLVRYIKSSTAPEGLTERMVMRKLITLALDVIHDSELQKEAEFWSTVAEG